MSDYFAEDLEPKTEDVLDLQEEATEEVVEVTKTLPLIDEDIKVENAVLSKSVKDKPKAKPEKKKDLGTDKVALFSTKNLHSAELGKLELGYNIVSAQKAEKWLKHKAVRKATPEEVASAYGK